MKKREVGKILADSNSDDWIKDDETGNFTYKKDLNLRIEREAYEDHEEIEEEWAVDNPDNHAVLIRYTIKYNNSFVDRKALVSVDNHRALLPYPKNIDELVVTENAVNFAKIVSISDRVDEYIRRSNFEIVPDTESNNWGW
jgi:hypothetical protein